MYFIYIAKSHLSTCRCTHTTPHYVNAVMCELDFTLHFTVHFIPLPAVIFYISECIFNKFTLRFTLN